MASPRLTSVLKALTLVGATTLLLRTVALDATRRLLEECVAIAPNGAAGLDQLAHRIDLAGGLVACLAVAGVLATSRAGGRETGRSAESEPAATSVTAGARTIDDEVAHMRQRLARTERIAARREVARLVAHEIKNPLAPIRASVETLRRLRERQSPEFDAYFDEATRTVLAEVRRIATIVTEFSKFARMPAPEFASVSLAALLRDVVALHDAPDDRGARHIYLTCAEIPTILADSDQLTQVFTNLVQNGIDAAGARGVPPELWVDLDAPSEREVRVRIRDNGPGIEPSIRTRLFEPYVTTKPDGTGLGLALVQTIVHEHGGDVRLADDAPTGAVFEIVLPVQGPAPLAVAPAITVEPHAR